MRNGLLPISITALYLISYFFVLKYEPAFAPLMFLFAPLIVCWLIFSILKYRAER